MKRPTYGTITLYQSHLVVLLTLAPLPLVHHLQLPHRIRCSSQNLLTTVMAISKRAIVVAAAAITFVTQRYAQWATLSTGAVWNTLELAMLGMLARFCWGTLVYPLLLSPLRHLPQAPVRINSTRTIIR